MDDGCYHAIIVHRRRPQMTFCQYCCAQSSGDAATTAGSLIGADISSLLKMLGSIRDPRQEKGKQHELEFVLAVCVVAALAGAKGYSEIARRARDMPPSLLAKLGAEWDWFESRYKCPSKGTIRVVLSGIDGNSMDKITGRWLAERAARGDDGKWVIAIDGKVLRGAWTSENDAVTLLSAMIHEEGITIAQVRVPDGTNEITQAGALLDALPVPEDDHVIFTLDAAHTQERTARAIRKRPEWHYVMNVKGNQPTLQRAVFDKVLSLLKGEPHDIMEDRSRGRVKRWSCWITGAGGINFPGASQAAIILREIFEVSGDRVSKEIALMLTSHDAGKMTATDLSYHERNHWGIENKSHYVRDTVYREDHGKAWAGSGPHVLAIIVNLAIGLIRLKGINAIKETTEWIAGDRTRALRFMTS
jgi:predicted transposase YbfD/YdcC